MHPEFAKNVDVIALPVDPSASIVSGQDRATTLFPYSLDSASRTAALYPTAVASIVGFAAGLTVGGKLPFWTRGAVATEPAAPIDGLPVFLVDARTRPGQSGSPVIGYWIGPRVLGDGTDHVEAEDRELLECTRVALLLTLIWLRFGGEMRSDGFFKAPLGTF